ncbi:MAG: zinc-dependent metalloprotease [Planctomycetota bacterium]|nr:zinc-dependent metalloprotease [Planctomycetota bacterium]
MTMRRAWTLAAAMTAVCGCAGGVLAQEGTEKKDDFKPWAEVSKDYSQVVSTAGGESSLYGVWKRDKDGQMLAELPRNWSSQRHFIAMTVPTGEVFAGLQAQDMYVYWKRFDKRMALVMPNVEVRSTGDKESKDSIKNHFVDRVIIDVPIVAMGPSGQPVIDLDELLVQNATTFYGAMAQGLNSRLVTLDSVKAFPENVEVTFTAPAAGGRLKSFHYSISLIKDDPEYKPRAADERVGYFTTEYRDLGKFQDDKVSTRYINRWKLEKADPNLKLSPPKEPIIYYVEHTVPTRYRRWVKDGTLYWNAAFEKVGIRDAVEVYYQDKTTGAHMDKDPEDVRYNFIRWLSNDIGTAIGPSRAHPITGQILDADIVLTDGWIRHFWYQANEYAPSIAMEGMSPETLAWLESRPQWDPRVRLAPPSQRERIMHERLMDRARRGVTAYGGAGVPMTDVSVSNSPELRAISDVLGPRYGLCMASEGMARDMAVMGLYLDVAGLLDDPPSGGKDGDKADKKDKKDEPDRLDGIPEWFVGPALAHLTVHEVGHTLGLRHNFKASAQYTFAEINSEAMKGKPYIASVMDYTPVNINMDDKLVQGDHHMIGVGKYDMWAIEYGYTLGDTKDVLKRVGEPGHEYLTDEDTGGPDPLARRYDFGKDPLTYAKNLLRLAEYSRGRILDSFVKDGEPWSKARRGYEITLNTQSTAVNIMANWIGGAHVNRDRKGDKDARPPLEPVSAGAQRDALEFVIDYTFRDEAFGLTPELLTKMVVNKDENASADPAWAVHDRISGIQASVLTQLMNPGKLRRVYDNEFFTPADQDQLTLPELLNTVSDAVWTELDKGVTQKYTPRKPMISSLRRALQREHAERLIDLTLDSGYNVANKAIANLATDKLREIQSKVTKTLDKGDSNIDPYTKAHLSELKLRITKALDASYIYNAQAGGAADFPFWLFMGQQQPAPAAPAPASGE